MNIQTTVRPGRSNSRASYSAKPQTGTQPQTVVEKIVSQHVERTVFTGEKINALPMDILYFNEVIGPSAIKDFYFHFGDI